MVKFGKNKFKALNKHAKKQKLATAEVVSNKILKKKINSDKKVAFHKEVLYKETVSNNALVKKVNIKEIIDNEITKKSEKKKSKPIEQIQKPKQKSVEKHKKRQKTQLNDTKLLLNLMKKSKNL